IIKMECQVMNVRATGHTDGFSGISISDLGSSCPEIETSPPGRRGPGGEVTLIEVVRPPKLLLRLVQPVDMWQCV
ncbi:hypothetical protein AVEN_201528-1, partial [Araneus ventricosus]